MECGARKRDGTPCKAKAMPNGRCRIHGGLTPVGPALPQYRDGRYSRVLPARLAGRYQEAAQDTALLELRSEVALLDARLADLLGRVDTGESGALWRALAEWRLEALAARKANDTVKTSEAINAIFDLIQRGHADYQAWREVGSVIEQRRKLVESERKRLIEMQQTLTAEKAMLLLGAVLGVIKEHVQDRNTLHAISRGIEQLTTIDAG
ncbi:MAG TPA: HGGxSTG domain-containing protein [Roseiflexaceae bacterium]|nr:HGGxSTG domain-containing protein [Roseiflexaceae bacterium]